MTSTHFSVNLRLLSTYAPSISELSRRLGINRSQMNKYLSGMTSPRPALMRRIGDYFGVEVYELLMPPSEFTELIRIRGVPRNPMSHSVSQQLEKLLLASDPRLISLCGAFYEYCASMSVPGQILCSLVYFEQQEGVLYYRRLERIGLPNIPCKKHYRYQGVALMLGDRIFLSDHECELNIELTQSILYPDYVNPANQMLGIKLGVSANHERSPCATRTFLERTNDTSIFKQLRRCGLYDAHSMLLPDYVINAIDNTNLNSALFLSENRYQY